MRINCRTSASCAQNLPDAVPEAQEVLAVLGSNSFMSGEQLPDMTTNYCRVPQANCCIKHLASRPGAFSLAVPQRHRLA
jgi:hypothetical protein